MTVLCITFNIRYNIIYCSLFSLCLLGFSLGTLASSHTLNGKFKLTLGMNATVNGCLTIC